MKAAKPSARKPSPPATPPLSRPAWWKHQGWIAALLTFMVYFTGLQNDFVPNWDDGGYVLEHEPIQHINGENLAHIFTSFYKGNYHPLTTLVYALQYALVADSPFLYHLTNILIHCINVLLVFLLIRRLFGQPLTAFWVALIFGIHPMHVESVAWISELKDVLYTFFYLLAFNAFLDFRKKNGWHPLVMSLVFFLLSLLSKSAAVTLPLVLLLTDWLRREKFRPGRWLPLVPFFLLSLVFGVVAIRSQGAQGAIQDLTPLYTATDRVFIVGFAIMTYVVKLIAPFRLMAMYPYPSNAGGSFPWEVYAAPAAVLVLLVLLIISLRRSRVAAYGGLFFLATSILTLQILPVGGAVVAERYTYIPYIGLSLVPVWLLVRNHQHNKHLVHWRHLIIGAFSIFFIALTLQRIPVWENGLRLFTDLIAKNPTLPFAYNNRGYAYQKYYGDMQKSLEDYSMAIAFDSTYYRSLSNRGVVLFNLGRIEEAIPDFTRSLRYRPDNEDALIGRANSLSSLGKYAEALADYDAYLQLRPEHAEAWLWRAVARYNTGAMEEALTDIAASRRLDPGSGEAAYWAGLTEKALGRPEKALEALEEAVRLDPGRSDAYMLRGLIHYEAGAQNQAIDAFSASIQADTRNAAAYVNRSAAWSAMGRFAEAAADLEMARRLGYPVETSYLSELQRKAGGQ
ncbi:MAG TPA: tetratricopeptide repeat protein [Bacteroidales bacterium]|nr:tetratricopeptide repeat protein [Bacteroidales bacterium]HRZ76978.1 tetratricopeptide repeat protein [Bacteroidales bacterium]